MLKQHSDLYLHAQVIRMKNLHLMVHTHANTSIGECLHD